MKRIATILLAIAIWSNAGTALGALVTKWLKYGTQPNGTQTTLLNTELNSIGNNACSTLGAAKDFSLGGSVSDGYLFCSAVGIFTFAAAPNANSGVEVYLLGSDDGGTTYESTPNCSTIALGRRPDFVLPATTGQTGTVVSVQFQCPKAVVKAIAKNSGTGQSTNGSGVNFIKVLPYTPEGVAQ